MLRRRCVGGGGSALLEQWVVTANSSSTWRRCCNTKNMTMSIGGTGILSRIQLVQHFFSSLTTTTRTQQQSLLRETFPVSSSKRRRTCSNINTFMRKTSSSLPLASSSSTSNRLYSSMCLQQHPAASAAGGNLSLHNNNTLQYFNYNRYHQQQQSRGFAWNKKWKQKAPRKKLNNNNSRGRGQNTTRLHAGGNKKKKQYFHEDEEDLISLPPDNIFPQQQGSNNDAKMNLNSLSMFIPPAVLLPTGSPYVYVAAIAAQDAGITDSKRQLFPNYNSITTNNSDDDNDANVHTTTATTTTTRSASARKVPRLFRQASFEYFSPTTLNYELPGSNKKGSGSDQQRGSSSIPEVAFLGKSNVGKSSLINALMGRDLARISKQPGRTQFVHYYGLVPHSILADHQRQKRQPSSFSSSTSSSSSSSTSASSGLILDPLQCQGFFVDLPGYGYAVAPDDKVNEWQMKTQCFLQSRITTGNLRRLFLLLDARHGATTFDHSIMVWLEEAQIPYTIVYTKADCVTKPIIVKHVNQTCLRYHHLHVQRQEEQEQDDNNNHDDDDDDDDNELYMSPIVHVTSSKTGTSNSSSGFGLRELLENIEAEFLLVPSTK